MSNNNNDKNNINDINEHFKLPIFYNKEKMTLKDNIIQDLELVETIDTSNNSMYNYIFNTKTSNKNSLFTEKISKQVSNYYTTDTTFLKETQQILKNYKKMEEESEDQDKNLDKKLTVSPEKIIEVWKEIKDDTGFKERYHYIDWSMWESFNTSESFLQILSVYTMASPVLSLITPLIILIIPFFIIKLKGLPLTVSDYIVIIKQVVSNHALGKLGELFTNNISREQKIYITISVGFYIFSIYQNILTCIRFHNNMTKIHNYLETLHHYLDKTILKMNHLQSYTNSLTTYREFNQVFNENIQILDNYRKKIANLGKYKLSITKIMEIGIILKNFYDFYDNKTLHNAFLYSFGFNGYYQCIEGLTENIHLGKINYIQYTKRKERVNLKIVILQL